MTIRDWLKNGGVLFRDGGMGTMLMKSGLTPGHCAEDFNVDHPEAVRAIHGAYAAAGANFILSNTFGGNRIRLKKSKYALPAVVEAGVRLARAAADAANTPQHPCYSLFDVGPLGVLLEPFGDMEEDEAAEVFSESIEAGLSGNPDGILIETMGDFTEMRAAVTAARQLTDLPVFATMTFDEKGRLFTGLDASAAMAALSALPVDMIGVNCGVGPEQVIAMLPALTAAAKKPLAVSPNAGLPTLVNGEAVYQLTPAAFAEDMAVIKAAGVRLLGGCCGTTPDHIRAMVARCKDA